MNKAILLREDFSSFKLGDFPYEPFLGAMGEYHYRPPMGYAGPWYDATPIMGSGGTKTWMIVEGEGRKWIEYSAAVRPGLDDLIVLAAGETDWTDYTVSCRLRLLLSKSCAGLIFRYRNSLCFYGLFLHDGRLELIRRDQEKAEILAEMDFPHTADESHELTARCLGPRIECMVDGERRFAVEDGTYGAGRIALGALAPARFTVITVETDASTQSSIASARRNRRAEVAAERANYPQPLLWRAINLRDFGAGRSLRYGRLSGKPGMEFLMAQCQRRITRDAFAQISCLTAFDLEGRVLWQQGEPNPEHALLTADLPFQVHDIDGDGRDEAILARDFKLMILDGPTGEVRKWTHTPRMERADYPFDRLNVDAIRLCDLSGKGRPTEILIKDRYKKLWAYDAELNPLWTYDAPVNTGHFPYTRDVNGDGREEVFVGYDLLDADGRRLWSLPIDLDHTDEIIIARFDPEGEEMVALVSGSMGFILADLEGRIRVRHRVGHAQRISAGNYRPDLPGLEICVSTYWGNQGIIYLYDCKGRLLWSDEPGTNGNLLTPVDWTGDGRDLILLNGEAERGGLIDGHNRQMVRFPADGHPTLCAEAVNLTGDAREEIVLWDEKMMWIYTQEDGAYGSAVKPEKYPRYNASNYRGEYAIGR